jgi:hypothetical protein
MKQLIDLLDQIAGAAARDSTPPGNEAAPHGGGDLDDEADPDPDADAERPLPEPPRKTRDVAATARAAIDAMRRGVIAYTLLTD